MAGVNKVILLGRLGRDPELKDANGIAVCSFPLATSKEWRDEGGEKHERTEWHSVVCFRRNAEIAGKYLAKGRQVYVEGEIQTRSWDDKETGAKRYKTEVVAHNIQFVSSARDSEAESSGVDKHLVAPSLDTNNDIPF